MDINKFSNEPRKPFHSSGYAEIANRGNLGSTSSQSFQKRYRADQNRQIIRKYRDSYVGRGIGAIRSTPMASSTSQSKDKLPKPPTSRPPAASSPPKSGFVEPPVRSKYNPYK